MGWTDRGDASSLAGVADLVPAAGLLLDRRRARWMLARAALNAFVCLVYARVLAEGSSRHARAGVAAMAALTLFDYALSRRLRGIERQ